MTYYLFAYCRRNGVSREAGLAASGDFADDQAAMIGLSADAADLKQRYDEVQWTLKAGGDEHGGPDGGRVMICNGHHVAQGLAETAQARWKQYEQPLPVVEAL